MTRIYDGDKHTALEAERARLQTEISAVATRMNEEYESDAWTGEDAPGKVARYQADNIRHAQLSRDLESVERQIGRMEEIRPLSNAERRANPILDIRRRWCLRGTEMLDEGERQVFCPERTPEMQKDLEARGLPADGSFFDPWAMATDYSRNPLPATNRARMAVGDPSRSDISSESASGAGDALGAAAPETWAAGVVEALQYYGSVASNCYNFNTSDGNNFHQNGLDTKDEEGTLLSGQSQHNTRDTSRSSADDHGPGVPPAASDTIGNTSDIIFTANWLVSNFIEARIESFNDIHFDVAGRVMREMERRLGRGWNRVFTVGAGGTGEPEGIALSGTIVDGKAGSADDGSGGIDYQNLLDMEYAVDLAYLEGGEGGAGGFTDAHGGMIGWMMNRNVEKQLRNATLFGTSGLPVWVPDPTNMGVATQRAPGRILGYPYSINNHMGNGKKDTDFSVTLRTSSRDDEKVTPLLFGSCGHFAVRNVGGPLYYRFWDSATATRMAVKFIGYSRRDSRSRGPHSTSGQTRAAGVNTNTNEAYCVLQVKA